MERQGTDSDTQEEKQFAVSPQCYTFETCPVHQDCVIGRQEVYCACKTEQTITNKNFQRSNF